MNVNLNSFFGGLFVFLFSSLFLGDPRSLCFWSFISLLRAASDSKLDPPTFLYAFPPPFFVFKLMFSFRIFPLGVFFFFQFFVCGLQSSCFWGSYRCCSRWGKARYRTYASRRRSGPRGIRAASPRSPITNPMAANCSVSPTPLEAGAGFSRAPPMTIARLR